MTVRAPRLRTPAAGRPAPQPIGGSAKARGWGRVLSGLCLLSAVLGAFLPAARGDDAEAARARARRHASITEGMDCSACHTPVSWDGIETAGDVREFDHNRTGFPLTGQHQAAACGDCHRTGIATRRDCANCHRDEHGGRLGSLCGDCHSPISWQLTRVFEIHRTTRLPLTGMHALLDCAACHRATGDRTFSAVPADCYACHARDYNRPGIHPVHTGNPPFPRDCSLCHRASAWSPAVVDPQTLRSIAGAGQGLSAPRDHDLHFTISFGPHRGAPCQACHAVPGMERASLRCVGCHAHSPMQHALQHADRAAPRQPQACLACHPGGMR